MKLLLCVAYLLCAASAYRILVMTPLPSKSHHHLGKGIVRSLLKANHEVFWVTPFPQQEIKGLTIVDVSSITDEIKSLDITGKSWSDVNQLMRNVSLATFHHPAVQQLMVTQQYHAVVTEWFMTDFEAGYAAVQQAPWVLLSTLVMHPHLELLVDTVRSVSTIPLIITNYDIPMSFTERFINTLTYWVLKVYNWKELYANKALYESHFGPLAAARGLDLPPFSAALHNISILLVNSHPSVSTAQSLPPNVVEIGGYHIDEDVPALPEDLQDIVDSSTTGVILFSMGSIVNASSLLKTVKYELVNLFGKLPYTVLWKFDEEFEDLPKNVHVRKWMPQNSILAHPNLKVFISHCGLLSTLESLYFGVPVLAVPVFGDQHRNSADELNTWVVTLNSVNTGRALKVDFTNMVQVEEALREITENQTYNERAKYLSKLYRTRPVSPSRLVSFYIELAIETKGAFHLRSKALLYSWYEIENLDVIAVMFLIILIIYFACKTSSQFVRWCCKRTSTNSHDKKKKVK